MAEAQLRTVDRLAGDKAGVDAQWSEHGQLAQQLKQVPAGACEALGKLAPRQPGGLPFALPAVRSPADCYVSVATDIRQEEAPSPRTPSQNGARETSKLPRVSDAAKPGDIPCAAGSPAFGSASATPAGQQSAPATPPLTEQRPSNGSSLPALSPQSSPAATVHSDATSASPASAGGVATPITTVLADTPVWQALPQPSNGEPAAVLDEAGELRQGGEVADASRRSLGGGARRETLAAAGLEGEAHHAWPDGGEYSGQWLNGLPHGRGIYVWPSGDRYEGEWVAGLEEGAGTAIGVDGSTFWGSWANGQRHGEGVYQPAAPYNARAPVMFLRNYQQGQLVKETVLRIAEKDLRKKAEKAMARHAHKADSKTKLQRPGETIYKGHRSYDLMRQLQLGITFSIAKAGLGASLAAASAKLPDSASVKLEQYFPASNQCSSFKWKDYAPAVFLRLRELFGMDSRDYLLSLTGDRALRELPSPGKSGSVFFLSDDDRFMIKTVRRDEMKTLMRKVIPAYAAHVEQNPDTLLTRFYGVHRVKPLNGNKVRFVVMGNVFPSDVRLHRKFDLKGSTYGRTAGAKAADPNAILKDLDVDMRLQLDAAARDRLLAQLARDCGLLERLHVMDYSLLLGAHYPARGSAAALPAPSAQMRPVRDDQPPTPLATSGGPPVGGRQQQPPQAADRRADAVAGSSLLRVLSAVPTALAALPLPRRIVRKPRQHTRSGYAGDIYRPSALRSAASKIWPSSTQPAKQAGEEDEAAHDSEPLESLAASSATQAAGQEVPSTSLPPRVVSPFATATQQNGAVSIGSSAGPNPFAAVQQASATQGLQTAPTDSDILPLSTSLPGPAALQASRAAVAGEASTPLEGSASSEGSAVSPLQRSASAQLMGSGSSRAPHHRPRASLDDDARCGSLARWRSQLLPEVCRESLLARTVSLAAASPARPQLGYATRATALARTADGTGPEPVLLYFGIIDFLQDYSLRKQAEHGIKALLVDARSISVVDPHQYSQRFQAFLADLFVASPPPPPELQR